MGIYEHLCDAVGKRPHERDLGCIDTPEVSFYAGITHFPSVYRGRDNLANMHSIGRSEIEGIAY